MGVMRHTGLRERIIGRAMATRGDFRESGPCERGPQGDERPPNAPPGEIFLAGGHLQGYPLSNIRISSEFRPTDA